MAKRGDYKACHTVIQDDLEFQKMSMEAKGLFWAIKMSRLNNRSGIFVVGPGELVTISLFASIPVDQVVELLKTPDGPLAEGHWIYFVEPLLWIRNNIKSDPFCNLDNANNRKGIVREAAGLPNCELLHKFIDYYDLRDDFPNLPTPPSKGVQSTNKIPILNKIPIPNKIPILNKSIGRPSKEKIKENQILGDIIAHYLTACPSLPSIHKFKPETIDIAKLSGPRRKRLLRRWLENPSMDWWREYFERIEASDFLAGRSSRTLGHENWQANFDWILKPINRDKIMEGNYDNVRQKETEGAARSSGRTSI